jgi:hypothetical protein
VTQSPLVSLLSDGLERAQVWSKSVTNEGHFTLVAETAFCPYLGYHYTGATQTSYVLLPEHGEYHCNFGRNRSVKKATLFLSPKQFFVPVLTTIAAGRLKRHSCHFLHTHYKQRKCGRNRSVTKGILLLWPKQFFARISTTIALGRLKRYSWQSLHTR